MLVVLHHQDVVVEGRALEGADQGVEEDGELDGLLDPRHDLRRADPRGLRPVAAEHDDGDVARLAPLAEDGEGVASVDPAELASIVAELARRSESAAPGSP